MMNIVTKRSITLNERKNRIYIVVEGLLSKDEAVALSEDYRTMLARCSPGFTVVTDVKKFDPVSDEVQKITTELPAMAQAAGVSKVARITGDNPLGGMQICRLAQATASYPSRHFSTMEEAEAYLDSDEE